MDYDELMITSDLLTIIDQKLLFKEIPMFITGLLKVVNDGITIIDEYFLDWSRTAICPRRGCRCWS